MPPTGPSDSSHRKANPDDATSSEPGIPLQSLAVSLEAPQRNLSAVRGKAAPLGQQMHEEIYRGTYQCAVCLDDVTETSRIWSCRTCWGAFHVECIRDWAERSTTFDERTHQTPSDPVARCPTCRVFDTTALVASCWCGREAGNILPTNRPPNSCAQTCRRRLTHCSHRCPVLCHAGPCPPCEKILAFDCFGRAKQCFVRELHSHAVRQQSTTVPSATTQWPESVRMKCRGILQKLRCGSGSSPWFVLAISLILNTLIASLICLLASITVQPYKYRAIHMNSGAGIFIMVAIVTSALLVGLWNVALWCEMKQGYAWLRDKIHPDVDPTGNIAGSFGPVVGLVMAAVLLGGPLTSSLIVPAMLRDAEFRHVCDGFDTMVQLDYAQGKPLQSLIVRNQDSDTWFRLFITEALRPNPTTNTTARHYVLTHEPGIETESAHLESWFAPHFSALDFDLAAQTWSTSLHDTPLHNGTFLLRPHLILPELGLQAPDFGALFLKDCVFDPYVKVHRGIHTPAELLAQAHQRFTHNDDAVVVRTAAFGWSADILQVCAKRQGSLRGDGEGEGETDMLDAGLVVAGLIAVLRIEGQKDGWRELCEGDQDQHRWWFVDE
ncbi:MAG: Transcriptional repressor NF-X1 [Caeruleum heppii]|nr:MAG: Transcriptional repressor NF-X1 [Caeruleum heppii]